MKDNSDLMGIIATATIILIPLIFIGYGFFQQRKAQKKKEEYRKRRARFRVIK